MRRPPQSALDLALLLESLSPPPGAPPEWEAVRRTSAAKARAAARTELRGGVRRTVERPRLHKAAILGELLVIARASGMEQAKAAALRLHDAVKRSRIVGERRAT